MVTNTVEENTYWTVDVCEGQPTLKGFHTWHTGMLRFKTYEEAFEFAMETYDGCAITWKFTLHPPTT